MRRSAAGKVSITVVQKMSVRRKGKISRYKRLGMAIYDSIHEAVPDVADESKISEVIGALADNEELLSSINLFLSDHKDIISEDSAISMFTKYYKTKDSEDRLDSTGYKLAGLHCIAKKAHEKSKGHGPHIALTVMSGRIYAAINTMFNDHKYGARVDPAQLSGNIHAAIKDLVADKPPYNEIKKEMEKVGKGATGRPEFEGELIYKDDENKRKEICDFIGQIKDYPITVVEAVNPPTGIGEAMHGEMVLMAHLLEHHKEALKAKEDKLSELEDYTKDDQRVLRVGGTRISCNDCFEKFEEINEDILQQLGREHFVLSSRNKGLKPQGWKDTFTGTTPTETKVVSDG